MPRCSSFFGQLALRLMPSSDGQDASSENTSGEDAPDADAPEEDVPSEDASGGEDSPPEQVVETVECPNCGRVFTGTYCPDCGQEADPSTSITGVIGGFFREFGDLENGFWPTFVGLTLRPGTTASRYLEGARRPFLSPGRYLLVGTVFTAGVNQLFRWMGIWDPGAANRGLFGRFVSGFSQGYVKGYKDARDSDAPFPEAAWEESIQSLQQLGSARVFWLLITTVLLGLLYRLLFPRETRSSAQSVALAAFTMGHAMILYSLGILVLTPLEHHGALGTEAPQILGTSLLVASFFAYPGILTYRCFGASWSNGLKGALGMAWAFVDTTLVAGIVVSSYAQWLLWTHPDAYPAGASLPSPLETVILLVLVHVPIVLYTVYQLLQG